ncbi:site-specific integrase [Bremerella cremea]|uniref:Tyr recombinase domain-containing protein n=1 Tax=Blastopirellula marina TaxID=124 RepID=A0A2S8FZH1_9BACT|nr:MULTISPECIES: tyrosine-type recombinase/integrase [Pirellulaceae]PQO37586.1 hypothetical protein C5Y83_06475 [Blastopirellula marina]RCS49973.1 site-specific integrase [Bremerella cremea]
MARLIPDSRKKHGWRYEPVISGKRLRFSFTCRLKRTAERTVLRIDDLIESAVHRTPLDGELLRWLEEIDERLFKQLVRAGLAKERAGHTVQSLTNAILESKEASVKPRTIVSMKQTQTSLIDFFGADCDITTITPGDADEFKSFLQSPRKISKRRKSGETYEKEQPGLAAETVQRRLRNAKSFFNFAVRKKFIKDNPFADMRTGQRGNRARMFHVDTALAYRVLDALPNARWRLLFSLYRWGGLRFNEALLLTWDDVVADQRVMMVPDEKGATHGRPVRKVPLFDEIEPYLLEVWEDLSSKTPGNTPIFVELLKGANPNQYLRNYFIRYLERAGITPWPRIFQNLRSTRATELSRIYASHVVRAILGHTEEVAQTNYLQPLEEDYDAIRQVSSRSTDEARKKPAEDARGKSDAFARRFTRTRHPMYNSRQSPSNHDSIKKPRENKPGVSFVDGNCDGSDARQNPSSRPGRTRTRDQGIMRT